MFLKPFLKGYVSSIFRYKNVSRVLTAFDVRHAVSGVVVMGDISFV